ncbi:putative RNA-binding protein [Quillaja saponaria]|uniref:RNA-binding protein n=1 Tax=Quillaja saponaria TaxID=32244 RepID=A0AAD7PNK0_QUISA|nr:putative RNA-binding protein [Quillaja saponaria]
MSATETPKRSGPPQIFKLDKALKLAEQWVNNMSQGLEAEPTVETEGRPARLGLGAKVSRQSRVGPSNDPVERKLHAKLAAGKRKAAKVVEESTPFAKDGFDDEDDSLDSRTNAFAKKRAAVPGTPLLGNKKQK